MLTGLNTTPVDCVLYDFSVEIGDSWIVYDADWVQAYEVTLMSKTDTIVWGNTIPQITSPSFYFYSGSDFADWGYHEWVSYDYNTNQEMTGGAGIVKRGYESIAGVTEWYLSEFYAPLSTENDTPFPVEFKLFPAYPNPFNPSTTIRFSVETRHAVSLLQIYDITGRVVETLVMGDLVAGKHKVVWDASGFSSGIYFVRLESGTVVQTQKIVLMK